MNLVKVKLQELKHDNKNARKHSERNIEEIKRSLQVNEQYRPFVVQRSTNRICIGNGMYEAMIQLGYKEGWVEYRDLTDEEAIKLALTDNRTSELAEWDMSTLADLFQEMGSTADVPGWNSEEILALLEEDVFPAIYDNSNNEDDRGTRSLPSKSQMIISIGTLACSYDYDRTQKLMSYIVEKYGDKNNDENENLDKNALRRFCDELYSQCPFDC